MKKRKITCSIYVLKHSIDEKIYVGQTWHTLQDRWNGGSGYKTCPKLHHAIMKYGEKKFFYEILKECKNQEDADFWEKYYIWELGSIKNGYNLKHGGNSSEMSEESRQKMRNAHIGRIYPTGKKQSVETIAKRKKTRAENPWKPTPEQIKKSADKRRGVKYNNERKQRMSAISKSTLSKKHKLNFDLADEIRLQYSTGIDMNYLAIKYNVKVPTFWKIVNNLRWTR